MYNPPIGRDEYVELQNIGAEDLPLSEPSLPEHTWKIDGLGFAFLRTSRSARARLSW